MIEPKDVVLAILGSSAGLAGFVLAFLGIIIASYQAYSGATPQQVVAPYRTLGVVLLSAFALCLVTVISSLAWLVAGGLPDAYGVIVALFLVQLLVVFAIAVWATRMVLWG
jgi:hypothetical protein